MKKIISLILILSFIFSSVPFAKTQRGGLYPCLASCCIGPRVGLEMNEGSKIREVEWVIFICSFLFAPVKIYQMHDPLKGNTMNQIRIKERLGGVPIQSARPPRKKGGLGPALADCCMGHRVGIEMNDGRKIRTLEWVSLVPFVSIIPVAIMSYEAFSGKTMSQIAYAEKLDR